MVTSATANNSQAESLALSKELNAAIADRWRGRAIEPCAPEQAFAAAHEAALAPFRALAKDEDDEAGFADAPQLYGGEDAFASHQQREDRARTYTRAMHGASMAALDSKPHARLKLHKADKAFRFVTLWISKAPASSVGTSQAPGHVSVNALREVQIEDLLRRESIKTNIDQVATLVAGHRGESEGALRERGLAGQILTSGTRAGAAESSQSFVLADKLPSHLFRNVPANLIPSLVLNLPANLDSRLIPNLPC